MRAGLPPGFDLQAFPVLCVDDEPENLRLLERALRPRMTVWTASSGQAGLEVVRSRPVAVVLSDQRMPGMSGVEFLARVRELDPRTIRMLVTAYGDAATLGEAINTGAIFRYVAKPWSPPELALTVERAIERYALDRAHEALLDELAGLNRIARRLAQELDLEALLDRLLDALTLELGATPAAVLLFEPERGRLVRVRAEPRTGGLGALAIDPEHDAPLLDALRAGELRVLHAQPPSDEASASPWLRERLANAGVQELLLAPLVVRNELLGALAVGAAAGQAAAALRRPLEGLAPMAAVALRNARLVDDLRRSRQQMLRAERLGTLGTLAAGLAHEIDNPLVPIRTFLALAPEKRSDDDPEFWSAYHALASREVERIHRLVASMARLGRAEAERAPRAACDLAQLAAEVVTLLAPEAERARVALASEAEPELPKVPAVRDELQQLLLNLALNAIQATPAGGRVALRVRAGAQGGISVEVADSGPGVAPDDLERIFDPFYTTKGPDQGTGLGLMICERIVADHGGRIEVQSPPGGGCVFRVELPADPALPD